MLCSEHQQEATSKCTWCARAICEKCRTWAHERKLCPKCFAKLSASGTISNKRKVTPKIIENKDPMLSEQRIEEGKEMIDKKENKRPVPRIRNVPDKV